VNAKNINQFRADPLNATFLLQMGSHHLPSLPFVAQQTQVVFR